ncbi:unnamed protein product [Lampetra planeri]
MALKSEDAGTSYAKMVSDENLFTGFLEEALAPKRPSARRATMPSGRLASPTDVEDDDPVREGASSSGFDAKASGKTLGAPTPLRYSRHFLSDNSIFHVEKSLTAMQSGTQMIKLKGGPKGLPRLYYLDEQRSCIRWRPSRKQEKAKIAIDSVREVCEGRNSEIFQRYPEGSFDPACCLCIYHGSHTEWLAVVTGSPDEARSWLTGLRYLMAGINDEDCLAKRQRTRDQWLKQTFMEADKNGDGSLSIDEVLLLMHKLNVNLPRRKVKQMFQEADTDTDKGTLTFEEFCALYQKMSTRRDLYLILLRYSNRKDHLTVDELQRFLQIEQQMTDVSREHCVDVVNMFEPCEENKQQGLLGIDGFTNYMRSPEGDIFNMEHYKLNQDMKQPLSHYFIASSHNTYLTGDQLMSHSRADMYAWVLQAGCRCVEVDCWDGPDGEPIVYHGHTLTSKILFRDVIEIINKYAFVKSQFPVILSIENHCSVPQQKKMAECMREILADKLDLSRVADGDPSRLPSPQSLMGKILVKGKKLPANISDDAEEGDVSDEDSADEIEEACKLINGDNSSPHRKLVESFAKRRLEFMKKESKLRSHEEEVEEFTIGALPRATKPAICLQQEQPSEVCGKDNKLNTKSTSKEFSISIRTPCRQQSHMLSTSARLNGQESRGSCSHRASPRRGPGKTMKLSRALSDLVQYTRSVAVHDVDHDAVASSWQVSSFSENKASQMLQQKSQAFLAFNQRQLSRIYPSSYRVDSSNFNPQPYWNVGCQMVALNYQTSGRVMEMNRARFMDNGNCGYVLKPDCIFDGTFRPFSEDPLPGYPKTQLIVKVISGQQLPKPPDSMLGDRGEIIDPFVEVEIIGLPVDCCKEQTRVIDDNGFNPVWDETLVFTLHMPEMALIRFLVWDHDPIGRDFIGQRTISFNGMMPGYRHVYLEGVAEASVFVHVVIKEFSGKIKQVGGLKSLFSRSVKHGSLDSRTSYFSRRRSLGKDFLRRTSSVPAKGRRKNKSMSLLVTVEKEGEVAEQPACGSAAAGAVGNPGEALAADGMTATAAPVTSAPSRRDAAAEEQEEDDGGDRDASSRGAQADGEGCREGGKNARGRARLARGPVGACFGGCLGAGENCVRHVSFDDQGSGMSTRSFVYADVGDRGTSGGRAAAAAPSDAAPPASFRKLGPRSRSHSARRGPVGGAEAWPVGEEGRVDVHWRVASVVSNGAASDGLQPEAPDVKFEARVQHSKCAAVLCRLLKRDRGKWGNNVASLLNIMGMSNVAEFVPAASFQNELVRATAQSPSFAMRLPHREDDSTLLVGSPWLCGIGSACPHSAPDNHAHSSDLRSSTPPHPLLLHMINRASLKRASSQKSQSSDPPSPTCGANPDASPAAGGPTSRPDARHYASHPLLSHHASIESQDRDLSAASDSADSINGFDGDINTSSESSSDETLANRAEPIPGSQNHGLVTGEVTRRAGHCQDPLDKSMKRSSIEPSPMFSVNVTANDKLWRPLDGKSVRDSVASASSVSSADTVIDAFSYEGRSSIAMLKKKQLENVFLRGDTVGPDPRCVPGGLPGANELVSPPASSRPNEQMAVDNRVGKRAAAGAHERRARCDTVAAARPSWNRLYMQTLVQSSKAAAEVNAPRGDSAAAKSKSLGDLTSDDIVSNFQSKYKSICRSFITKSMREQRRMVALGRLPNQPQNPLTEQIIQLATLTQDEVPDSLHRRTTMPVNLLRSVSTEQQGASGPQRRLPSGQPPSSALKRSQFAQRYPASSYGLFRHSVGSLDGINVNPLLTERREAPDGACSTLTKARFMEEPLVVGKAPSYSEPNLSEEPEVFFMLNL